MNLQDIKKLKRDIAEISNIEKRVLELKENPTCDKLDFGFNIDSRFKGGTETTIFLGGYKGFYGSSSVYSIFDIHCYDEYKKALLETLNEFRPQILKSIAEKLQAKLKDESSVILKEIEGLQQLYEEANKKI